MPEPPAGRAPEQVVEELGRRLQSVPLLAPADQAAAAIRKAYGGLVEPQLLDRWAGDPASAPGRQVSSPWPDRIEVERVAHSSPAVAVVTGAIVERSSSGDTGRVPVTITLSRHGQDWLVSGYQASSDAASASTADNASDAVAVVRDYYRAIAARQFGKAYAYWGDSGPPNQTLAQFEKGFADTADVSVETGTPSAIGAAAGSRYVDVPVTVTARTRSGAQQRFEGTYTLRRSVVTGATAAQQRWHLYRASLRKA